MLKRNSSDSNTVENRNTLTESAKPEGNVRQISSTKTQFGTVEEIKANIIGHLSYSVINQWTIIGKIRVLKALVEGESLNVIKAKLLTTQQRGKTAAQKPTYFA